VKFYPFKWQDYLKLLLVFAVVFTIMETQRLVLPQGVRFAASPLEVMAGIFCFFLWMKPSKPFELSRSLCAALAVIIVLLIIIMHMAVNFDIIKPFVVFKIFYISAITLAMPFIIGWIYSITILKSRKK
jgi:hypothetical protein